jgi:PAS domain-containing protein
MREKRTPTPPLCESMLSELGLQMLVVNGAGRVVCASPRAESALAAQPGGLRSLMLDSLFSLRNPQWLSREIRKLAVQGHWAGEAVLTRLDGTECWVHVQACKVPAILAMPNSAMLCFEDITGHVELMATLMQRNEDLFRRNRELEIVSKVGRLLLADTDLECRLAATLREAAKTIGVSRGVVWVKSRDGQEIHLRGAYGVGNSILANGVRIGINDASITARTIRTGRPQVVEDVRNDPDVVHALAARFGATSALWVPMVANGDVIGCLTLGEKGPPRPFTHDEITLVEVLANSAASAIANALLAEDIEVSRAYWQRTFDSISDMIMVVDTSGKILRANDAVASHFDTTAPSLLGVECERLVPELNAAVVRHAVSFGKPEDLGELQIADERCEVRVFPLSHASVDGDAVVVYAKIISEERAPRSRAA